MEVTQQSSFDFEAGQAAKAKGMDEAAAAKASLLAHARELAVKIGQRQPTVTADDVALALECEGISVFALGSAAGSLFKGGKFEWTGEFVKSARIHAHSNLLRQWRLRP